jgi:hypothetical protein
LRNLGNLVTGPDDVVAVVILDDVDILVLPLSALPDLNLASTADDTDSHSGQQVVGTVRVEVDTTVEHGGSILANTALDESLATRVLVNEIGNVMDNTGNGNETTAVLGLLNIVVPLDDGELVERYTPVELGALLVDLLLELLDTTLLDLVGAELLEVGGEAELAPEPDGPLGGVVLVPLDGVAVVRGELVVEVVVTLAESDKRGDDVVPGAVAVVEGLVAEPVSERVDAEGSLLDKEDAEDTGVDETTLPVAPAEASHGGREEQAHEEEALDVVLVLPDNDRVLVEVGDVSAADALGVLLHDHPSEMAVQEALADAVGVLVGVGVAVVGAVVTAPPADGALNGASANGREPDPQRKTGVVRLVCPETMVSGCDAEAGPKVVHDGPESGLPLERRVHGGGQTSHGDADDGEDLQNSLASVAERVWLEALTLSQLTCWCQFARVMGWSVMCGFLGSYAALRLGSDVLAMGDGCLT